MKYCDDTTVNVVPSIIIIRVTFVSEMTYNVSMGTLNPTIPIRVTKSRHLVNY